MCMYLFYIILIVYYYNSSRYTYISYKNNDDMLVDNPVADNARSSVHPDALPTNTTGLSYDDNLEFST